MTKDWLSATKAGDVERVCALLDAGADINALDRHGQTALMNASHKGKTALVQALVQRGADLDHTAKYKLTALMLAVIANHPGVVRILVAAGANRELKGNAGPFARTPLEYAEEHNQTLSCSLLRNAT